MILNSKEYLQNAQQINQYKTNSVCTSFSLYQLCINRNLILLDFLAFSSSLSQCCVKITTAPISSSPRTIFSGSTMERFVVHLSFVPLQNGVCVCYVLAMIWPIFFFCTHLLLFILWQQEATRTPFAERSKHAKHTIFRGRYFASSFVLCLDFILRKKQIG